MIFSAWDLCSRKVSYTCSDGIGPCHSARTAPLPSCVADAGLRTAKGGVLNEDNNNWKTFLNYSSYTRSCGCEPYELLVEFPQWAIVELSLGLDLRGLFLAWRTLGFRGLEFRVIS